MAQSLKQYTKQQLKDILSIQSIGGIVQNSQVTDLQLSDVLTDKPTNVSYLYENQVYTVTTERPQYQKIKFFQTDEEKNLYKIMERSQREYFHETQELEKSIRRELCLSAFASENKLVNVLHTKPQKKALLQRSFNNKCICSGYLKKTYQSFGSPGKPLATSLRPLSKGTQITGKCYTQKPSPIIGKNVKLRNSADSSSLTCDQL